MTSKDLRTGQRLLPLFLVVLLLSGCGLFNKVVPNVKTKNQQK